jgi:hypothetical protein
MLSKIIRCTSTLKKPQSLSSSILKLKSEKFSNQIVPSQVNKSSISNIDSHELESKSHITRK